MALAGGKRGAEGVFRKELAVSRVVKYALSLSTVTFALAFGGFVDGLELGFNCVGNVKFCGYWRKSLRRGLDNGSLSLVATIVSRILIRRFVGFSLVLFGFSIGSFSWRFGV